MKSIRLTLLLCLTAGIAWFSGAAAQAVFSGIERGFEALSAYNYFEAKNIFLRQQKKMPCLSNFGLAVIYSRNDNPFYNLDSAAAAVIASKTFLANTGKKESRKMAALQINEFSLDSLKKIIEARAFASANATLTVSAFTRFLENFPGSDHEGNAIHKRDSLAFDLALNENSAEGYERFLESYPGSYLEGEARTRFDRTLFEESTSDRSIDSFRKFVEAYPSNPHVLEAMNMIYYMSTAGSTNPDDYHRFALENPNNPFVEDAWQRIYDLSVMTVDAKSILEFKRTYPDYPFMNQLEQELALANTVLLPFEEDELWGFADSTCVVIVPPLYDEVGRFSDGLALIEKDDKVGYLSKAGIEVIPPFYDDAEPYHNKLAVVTLGDKSGVVDRSGAMVVPLIYREIGDFNEGLAPASDGLAFGYINRNGTTMIPFRYESAGEFRNGTAVCVTGGAYGIINMKGDEIVPFQFDAAENFDGGLARVRKKGKYGLYRSDGTVLIAPAFDELGPFVSGRALTIVDGTAGYIDTSGAPVIPSRFLVTRDILLKSTFNDGFAYVRTDKGSGIIDTGGNEVVAIKDQDLGVPGDSLVAFRRQSKWGYYQLPEGKVAIPPAYSRAGKFQEGFAIAGIKSGMGLIDHAGKWKIRPEYERLEQLAPGYFLLVADEQFGLATREGDLLVKVAYESYHDCGNGIILFSNDKQRLWIDLTTGKVFEKK